MIFFLLLKVWFLTRGPIRTAELINPCFFTRRLQIELFERCAAGRIANSRDLFVGLYCYTAVIYSQLKTVDRAETFESWLSEKGVNSN